MNKEIKTSIQYFLTNDDVYRQVLTNWNTFNESLSKGPEVMKDYLVERWNIVKGNLNVKEGVIITDLDRVVSRDDFDVTYRKTENNQDVFFFKFPAHEEIDAAAIYAALVLKPDGSIPRYFTLETSMHVKDNSKCFVLGEWMIDENGMKKHMNYGDIDNDRLTYFSGAILSILESNKEQ